MSADHTKGIREIDIGPPDEKQRSLTVRYLREEFWIFDELWKRIDHHIEICEKQIKWFSKWALFNRYTLPLLTAFASGAAGFLAGIQNTADTGAFKVSVVVAAASFLATIISALNAAMRPALQYGHYVRFINRFWTQRILLEVEAEQAFLSAAGNDALWQKMHDVVTHRSQELDQVIEDFSEESVSNIGIPTATREA
jgi:hypothetical protein